ncbi:MAG: metal ABC transporter permease [Thermotogae bacterium]|nr:metal ABC transporter permease [Thermotogota bacterium]
MEIQLLVVLLGGILLGLTSFFVVSKGLAFATTGVAHAMFGGIALAVAVGVNPQIGGFTFGLLMGIGMHVFGRRLPQDAVIGLTFSFLMSVGAIALRFYRGYANLLWSYMFGNITLATPSSASVLLVLFVVVSTLLLKFRSTIQLYMFNEEIAAAERIPIRAYDAVIMLTITLIIIFTLRVFGSILTSSMAVVPALISFMLFGGFWFSLLMSAFISVLLSTTGYALAYLLDLPFGAITTTLSFLSFVMVWVLRMRKVWLKV